MDKINESILFKQLTQEQQNTVEACMIFTQKLWFTDRIIQYYTDHGPAHSIRILEYIEQMPNIIKNDFFDRDEYSACRTTVGSGKLNSRFARTERVARWRLNTHKKLCIIEFTHRKTM